MQHEERGKNFKHDQTKNYQNFISGRSLRTYPGPLKREKDQQYTII